MALTQQEKAERTGSLLDSLESTKPIATKADAREFILKNLPGILDQPKDH